MGFATVGPDGRLVITAAGIARHGTEIRKSA
jgi:hypothetical protein